MTEFVGYDEFEGDEELTSDEEQTNQFRKTILIGGVPLGDVVKHNQSRESFLRLHAKITQFHRKRYQHIIDGYRQMQKNLLSIQRPKTPKALSKAPEIRKTLRENIPPITGKVPETTAQNYGYMATKRELNLQIFGSEIVKPMHSCKTLLGFEYQAQR